MTPIINAVKLMGYRRLGTIVRWAKPLGYSLLVIDVEKLRFLQYYKGVDGKIHCWTERELSGETEEELVTKIQECENQEARLELPEGGSFSFLDLAQQAEEFLDAE
jgi:hypothetical protein